MKTQKVMQLTMMKSQTQRIAILNPLGVLMLYNQVRSRVTYKQ